MLRPFLSYYEDEYPNFTTCGNCLHMSPDFGGDGRSKRFFCSYTDNFFTVHPLDNCHL